MQRWLSEPNTEMPFNNLADVTCTPAVATPSQVTSNIPVEELQQGKGGENKAKG